MMWYLESGKCMEEDVDKHEEENDGGLAFVDTG
jgi:hypothetical protein